MSNLEAMKAKIRSGSVSSPHMEIMQGANENVNVDVNVKDIKKPSGKPKFEEKYSRATFYVEKNLLAKLDEISNEKGARTRIINEALIMYMKKYKLL